MTISAIDLIVNVVKPSLEDAGLYSIEAEQLLMGTCAQESGLGRFLRQKNGPALGIWMTEPATYNDIFNNYLKFETDKKSTILKAAGIVLADGQDRPPIELLMTNLKFACLIARVQYLRVKEPLPAFNDIQGQAEYWKDYYNTMLGAGTVANYISNYNALVSLAYFCRMAK